MSEENGMLLIKASSELLKKMAAQVGEDATEVLSELFQFAEVDSNVYERETYCFDSAQIIDDYILLKYDESCCEWSYIANTLMKKGKNIEIYANCNCYDESTFEYYALDNTGKKIAFDLPIENADEIVQEDEEFVDRVTEKSQQWKSMIPQKVITVSPEFAEVQLEQFLDYCE